MKLFLDYELNESGKGKFLQRLIPALAMIGVETCYKEKGCDVALGLSKWRDKPDMPRVLRIDGVHLRDGKKERWRNKSIRKGIKQSHAVIFQSKFAQRIVKKHLKVKPKKEYVIYNGVNPKNYTTTSPVVSYEENYLMSARWGTGKHERKSKRQKEHIRYAEEHPDIHFWLAGETDRKFPSNVTKLGWLEDSELRRYQYLCSHFVYLVKTDWCPSGVVEAIMAGCKIIYNPKCEAVKELCNLDVKELYIDNIAQQYKKVFEDVKS